MAFPDHIASNWQYYHTGDRIASRAPIASALGRMLNFIGIRIISVSKTADKRERHPGNVAGHFYSTVGCIICGGPAAVAPLLIAHIPDGDGEHFVVIKQPTDLLEIQIMIEAMQSSCIDCYRYDGLDVNIIKMISDRGMAHLCSVHTSY